MRNKINALICCLYIMTPLSCMDFLCSDAPTLFLQASVCTPSFTQINFNNITATSSGINTCNMGHPDLYVHISIPPGSTGNFMVRRRVGTTIEARAEVYYTPSCMPSDPSGCCFGASLLVGCYNFDAFPNAIILENQPPGDYYIKVWDDNGANTGTLNISAHELPMDISEWVLCDDESGDGTGFVANQLIIEPAADFNPTIFEPGFFETRSCACADPPLLLYEAADFATFLEGQITAKKATCVEGTGLNYIMETTREAFNGACGGIYLCGPIELYKPVKSSPKARIAIVDTGVKLDHVAFENALWENAEINDNDNCVTGDLYGYDFKNEVGSPMDTDGHGTWVAGTIIEDFPEDIQLEIMSPKFYDNSEGTLFEALCGMHYAIDEGASTIVTSWGFRSLSIPPFLEDVLQKGLIRDVLFVASAGNNNENIDSGIPKYPSNATNANLMTVAAYDEVAESLASYSNFGPVSVDLGAIGHVIAPSIVNNATNLSQVDSVVGTSIAAPRVARTALIMKATYPKLTYADIKDCILSTVDMPNVLAGLVLSGGILNHEKALACAEQKSVDLTCINSPLYITSYLINDQAYSTRDLIESNAYVEKKTKISFKALTHIQLRPNFEIELGATFEALIEICE